MINTLSNHNRAQTRPVPKHKWLFNPIFVIIMQVQNQGKQFGIKRKYTVQRISTCQTLGSQRSKESDDVTAHVTDASSIHYSFYYYPLRKAPLLSLCHYS